MKTFVIKCVDEDGTFPSVGGNRAEMIYGLVRGSKKYKLADLYEEYQGTPLYKQRAKKYRGWRPEMFARLFIDWLVDVKGFKRLGDGWEDLTI